MQWRVVESKAVQRRKGGPSVERSRVQVMMTRAGGLEVC